MVPGCQFKINRVFCVTILIVIVSLQLVSERQACAVSALTSSFNWQFIGPQPSNWISSPLSSALIFSATGRVTAVAADASNRVFVGTAGGGLWLSSDGGTTFSNINGSVLPYAIGAIALDTTTNPTTVYVGTGEGNLNEDCHYGQGIFMSSDLGSTWSQILAPGYVVPGSSPTEILGYPAITRLAIDTSHSPPYIFAGLTIAGSANRAGVSEAFSSPVNNGLWISTQIVSNQRVWSHVAQAQFPFPGGTTACSDTVFGSVIPASRCPVTDVAIDPQNPTQVYAGVENSDLFVSSNSGGTWTAANFNGFPAQSGIGGQIGRISVAVGPPASVAPQNCSGGTAACGVVYVTLGDPAGVVYQGFYMSTDGGQTWTTEQVPTVMLGSQNVDGTSTTNYGQSHYNSGIAVNPGNSSDVFFGGVDIYESTQSGAAGTWNALPSGGSPTHEDQHSLAYIPGTTTLLVGNDGGVYKWNGTVFDSTPNKQINASEIQVVGLYPYTPFANVANAVVGFQDIGTQLYNPATLAWVQASGEGGDGGFAVIAPNSPNNVLNYFVHAYNNPAKPGTQAVPDIVISTDSGASWANIYPQLAGTFKNDHTVFYPPLAADPTASKAHRFLLGAHYVYALTFNANGSPVWNRQSTTDITGGCKDSTSLHYLAAACAIEDIEFAPSKPTVAWAVSAAGGGVSFRVSRTAAANANTGAVWSNVGAGLPTTIFPTGIAVSPFDQKVAYVTSLTMPGTIATTGSIYMTSNSGTSWSALPGPTLNGQLLSVLRLVVDSSDQTGNSLLAGTDSGVYKSLDGGNTWNQFNEGVVPPIPVFDIQQNEQYQFMIGTHGAGAYRLAPPVIFRDVTAPAETCETGVNTCSVTVKYPTKTQFGDSIIAVITDGICHAAGDLSFSSGWQVIGSDDTWDAGCSIDGSRSWVLQRPITEDNPVPSSGHDTFTISNNCSGGGCGEAWNAVAAYSGASSGSIVASDISYKGSAGTSFTAPAITFTGHDGVAMQMFDDLPITLSENYDDTYGWWIDWTPPSDPTLISRYNGFAQTPRTPQLLTDVPLPNSNTYGDWTATTFPMKPTGGAPMPPATTGVGYGWTVVIPPGG
jgi:hypothetical protein